MLGRFVFWKTPPAARHARALFLVGGRFRTSCAPYLVARVHDDLEERFMQSRSQPNSTGSLGLQRLKQPARKRREFRKLLLEPLEDRRLLSTAPRIIDQNPPSHTNEVVSGMELTLSEPVVATGARNASTYELLDLGPNRVPGGGDDRILGVRPSYEDNATKLDLLFLSQELVDLTSWTVHDYLAGRAGTWNVATDGKSVTQTVNGSPTFFVGNFEFVDRQFLGRIRVNTTSDDDFIGLVFAFHTDPATKKPDSYYCLTWKQATQTTATEGLKLLRVTGMGQKENSFVGGAFWSGVNTENIQVLDTNLGSGKGWRDNTTYDFRIGFSRSGEIDIEIIRSDTLAVVWQTTVADSAPLAPGRVGFMELQPSGRHVQRTATERHIAGRRLPINGPLGSNRVAQSVGRAVGRQRRRCGRRRLRNRVRRRSHGP